MKRIAKKWFDLSLVLRIVICLVLGAVLGVLFPQFTVISTLGSVFVGALKGIAPLLVFALVVSAIANSSNGIGNRFRRVIIFYVLSTLFASLVAVAASFLFPVTMKLSLTATDMAPPTSIGTVISNIVNNAVTNPFAAIANPNYIAILFWAFLFGIALKKLSKKNTISVIADVADSISLAVRWIIQFAPIGILGLVFDAVSQNGLAIFYDYGKLLALLVGSMLAVALITNPLIVFIALRKNPYHFVWRCLKGSGVTAFFTRSTVANIPVNMNLCERLGVDMDFYSVSIPLGAIINISGAAVTITIMTLAVVNSLGLSVDFLTTLLLCLLGAIGACGVSGVAGGSLLLIPMACSLFNISNDVAMQAVAIGFIVGVIQDPFETALHSSGDLIFTATAEYRQIQKKIKKEFF